MLFFRLKKSLEWAVVLVLLTASLPLYGQFGGLTGKCTDDKGQPFIGHIVFIEMQDSKRTFKAKTNKKGEYIHIGLPVGYYNLTLQNPTGQAVFSFPNIRVAFGDATEVNFDMAKERAYAATHQEEILKANPELQKKMEERAKEQAKAAAEDKEFTSLKGLFDQGVVLYNSKQYAEAADMFEKALPLAKDKNMAALLARLADSYGKAGKYDKALEYYPKAIEANPTGADLHNNLGDIYARMGKLPEAQQEFQKAAELNPTGAAQYYFNLGALLYNAGKMDEAAAAFKKVTELDPNRADAYYMQGVSLMGKASMSADGKVTAPPGTVEALQTYLKLAPSGKNAAQAEAMLQTIQGKIDTQYKAAPKKKK